MRGSSSSGQASPASFRCPSLSHWAQFQATRRHSRLRVGATSDGVSVYWANWLKVYQEVCKAFELAGAGSWTLYGDIKALLERKGFAGMAPWDSVLSITNSRPLVEAVYSYKSAPVETQYSWQTEPLGSVAFYSTVSPFSGMKAFYRWPESAGDAGGVGFYRRTDLESYDWRVSSEPHGYCYTAASKE